jgi:hypothetical protein
VPLFARLCCTVTVPVVELLPVGVRSQGKYDGSSRVTPVAPPRSDIVSFMSTVPHRRAAKAAKDGVLPPPSGEVETDSDTDDEDGGWMGFHTLH